MTVTFHYNSNGTVTITKDSVVTTDPFPKVDPVGQLHFYNVVPSDTSEWADWARERNKHTQNKAEKKRKISVIDGSGNLRS